MAEMFLKVASALLLLYATADSLIVGVRAVHEVREKRSDDGGPLQAVVDQLSQQVNSLTAQLAAVNAEVAALKTQAGNYYLFFYVSLGRISPTIVQLFYSKFLCLPFSPVHIPSVIPHHRKIPPLDSELEHVINKRSCKT